MKRPRLLDATAATALVALNAIGNPFAFFVVFLMLRFGVTGLSEWLFEPAPKAREYQLTTEGAVMLILGSVLLAGLLVFGKWRLVYRPLHPQGSVVSFALSQKIFLLPYLVGAIFHFTLYQAQEANFFSFIITFGLVLLGVLQATFFLSQTVLWGWRNWKRLGQEHVPMPLENRIEPTLK